MELKIEAISTVKEEIVSTQKNHVSINTDTDEFEITPIDTSKHIEVDGKKYKNVKLKHKKTKLILIDTTRINTSKNSLIKVSVKNKSKEELIKKEVDKKANYFIYLWLLIIPVVIIIYKKLF
jgi:hypothetical protein